VLVPRADTEILVETALTYIKPGTRVLKRVLAEKGVAPAAAALVGDQIYTDVLCAGRAGILSVLVKPLCLRRNPLLALRYGAEAPFRLAARGRK